MLDDVRYALRGLARTPGFTAVALLMIALGTGANAAMFSIIDSVMLRSPFVESERLAVLLTSAPGGRGPANAVSLEQYRSLEASAHVFDGLGVMGGGQRPALGGAGDLRRINVECVSAGMFRLLGTPALHGRTFTEDEDRPGGPGAISAS
jgi:hypothetical protein